MAEDSPWRLFWGLMVLFGIAQLVYVGAVNPRILVHRMGLKKGTEPWDWVWLSVFMTAFVGMLLVAQADIEAGGALLPNRLRPVGVVLFVLGGGIFLRAMGENPFFEKTVRIQQERDHHVVETGPYSLVRHPGYVGLIVLILSFPLVLTSPRALYLAGFAAVCVVVRTVLEDRTLHAKLPGYSDYAGRVRWLLLPGVW
ncbi:MAG: isoprenylcysteine carboxylmethyltransferase family protein [Longimicrobiales bacterium]|jgi:protein-S-isoprenylcysteine O-methyltransferase Ste14